MKQISIRGARTHNLQNLDLELPRNRLIVITGLSGSGKSTLGRTIMGVLPESAHTEGQILFNGQDLAGWTEIGNEKWVVEDGAIEAVQKFDFFKFGEFEDYVKDPRTRVPGMAMSLLANGALLIGALVGILLKVF